MAGASLAVSIDAEYGRRESYWRLHNMRIIHSPLSPTQMKTFLLIFQSLLEKYSYSLSDYERLILLSFGTSLSANMEINQDGPIIILLCSDSKAADTELLEKLRVAAHHATEFSQHGGKAISSSVHLKITPHNISRGTSRKSGRKRITPPSKEEIPSSRECHLDPVSGSE